MARQNTSRYRIKRHLKRAAGNIEKFLDHLEAVASVIPREQYPKEAQRILLLAQIGEQLLDTAKRVEVEW